MVPLWWVPLCVALYDAGYWFVWWMDARLEQGEQELASLRRQVIVNALYAGDKSVIEVLGRDR